MAGTEGATGAPMGARVPLPVLGPPPQPAPRPTIPECYGDVCITCSDEAIPVTIVELLADDLANVDTGQSIEVVSVALVDAKVGDTILVHAKEAIAVMRAEPN
jgi:hydrogenase maturation factor